MMDAVLVLGLSIHTSNMQKPMEEERSSHTAGQVVCSAPSIPPAAQLSLVSSLSVPKPTSPRQLSPSLLS